MVGDNTSVKMEATESTINNISYTYTRKDLLDIKSTCELDNTMKVVIKGLPSIMKRQKRGMRRGIKVKLSKRKCKTPLPTVISHKIQNLTVKKWDRVSIEQLQVCLASTDWSIFLKENPSTV